MESTINIAASLIADAMGVLLLVSVVAGNLFVSKEQFKRNHYLGILVVATVCSCILDSIGAVSDGHNRIVAFACDTLLYLCGPVTAVAWIFLVAKHIKIKISTIHKIIIGAFLSAAIVLIVANLFTPVLFIINEYNVYERVPGLYVIYATSYFGLMIDAVVMYLLKKRESGGLKFFPMWVFVIPIAFGMIIQIVFFGVSTIAPFMTISITVIITSFQNKLLFRDQLTDLYNRYYLSFLEKKFAKKSSREYSVIMLDINDFKSINDIYGHDVGDEALVNFSNILVSIIDKSGEVIRYAGDEFIVILNSHDDAAIDALVARIHQEVKDFCSTSAVTYELAVAIGWCRFRFGKKSLNDFITEADKCMYNDKQEYYKSHQKRNRKASLNQAVDS